MLEGLTPPQRITPCKVRTVKAQIDESDVELLEAYIQSPDWSTPALSSALKDRGISLSPNTILKHRKGTCSC